MIQKMLISLNNHNYILQSQNFDYMLFVNKGKKERIGLQKEKIQLDQLVNSEFKKENISRTRLTGKRCSLNSDVVSQSNGIITLDKSIILREGEGEVSKRRSF